MGKEKTSTDNDNFMNEISKEWHRRRWRRREAKKSLKMWATQSFCCWEISWVYSTANWTTHSDFSMTFTSALSSIDFVHHRPTPWAYFVSPIAIDAKHHHVRFAYAACYHAQFIQWLDWRKKLIISLFFLLPSFFDSISTCFSICSSKFVRSRLEICGASFSLAASDGVFGHFNQCRNNVQVFAVIESSGTNKPKRTKRRNGNWRNDRKIQIRNVV